MYSLPSNSIIGKGFEKYDYCDSYSTFIWSESSVDEILTKFFKMPVWVSGLLKLRDVLVKPFGLQTGDEPVDGSVHYTVGAKAVYFTVVDRTESEIVMEEKDLHLKFRVSILKEIVDGKSKVSATTIVKFNNWGGRAYFFPVKPFHKMLIKYLLWRI
jgi:hypothetical protein